MKFTDLSKHLESTVEPIYHIIGGDGFLTSKTISIFKKKLISDFENLNFFIFDDENFEINQVISSLQQLPFGSNYKIVVLKNISKISENDKALLLEYAKRPNLQNCLLIIDNQKIFSFLQATEIDCSGLPVSAQQKLIASLLKNHSKQITVDGAEYLIEICNGNLSVLENEVTKLAFYSDDKIITKQDVQNIAVKAVEHEVFELTNALSKKNTTQAIEILKQMLDGKNDPSSLLGLIYSHFRRLFFVSTSNLSTEELANYLKVKPYAITKAKESLNSFSPKMLKKIYSLCEEVDYMNKSGGMSSENCLYYLIFNIANL